MAKICVCCGIEMGIFTGKVKLADGHICTKCYDKSGRSSWNGFELVEAEKISSAEMLALIEKHQKMEEARKRRAEEEKLLVVQISDEYILGIWRQKIRKLTAGATESIKIDDRQIWSDGACVYVTETSKRYLSRHSIRKVKQYSDFVPLDILVKNRFLFSDIIYYSKEGDVKYTASISGGGSSLAGALVGGLIAGDVGALIGSRQPVVSSTETHDSRKTVVRYNDKGAVKEERFDGFEFYNFLLKILPEKDLLAIQLSSQKKDIPTNNDADIKSRLQTLKSLFDDGLIDKDEYEQKRSELIKMI